MDLPHSYRTTLATMPDLSFGEDRRDYTQRVVAWGREHGISSVECLRCASIKWEAWEVERLLTEIEDDKPGALKLGIMRLLKDRYLP